MKIYSFIIMLIIYTGFTSMHAQDTSVKNLQFKIDNAKSTTEKAEIYFLAGDEIAVLDSVKAVTYVHQGMALIKDDPYFTGIGYFYLGRIYMEFSLSKASAVFDTALTYLQTINTPNSYVYQSRVWNNKAVIAQLKADNTTFINLFLERAIPLAGKGGDSLRVADYYFNVSLPFVNFGEYDKSIFYLNKSAELFERLAPKDLRLVDVYSLLAKSYLFQEKLIEARKWLNNAAAILENEPTSLYATNFHTIEGMYFISIKNWPAAENTINKGLGIAEKLMLRGEIRQLLYQKAKLYISQEKWEASKKVLLKMIKEGYDDLVTDKKQIYGDLAFIESHLGNYLQALEWKEKQTIVSEEVYQMQTKAKIADLEAKYNFIQKENELKLAKDKAEKQKQLVWLITLLAIVSLITLYFWYRNRRRSTVQKLKQKQQLELGKALLEGEEKERSRLARDLHDGLGGMIAGIKLNLSQMMQTKEILHQNDLQQTIDRLGYSVNELRRISRNLMPESLLQSGLETALKDLCDEASMPQLKVIFQTFGTHNILPQQVQLIIYRIVQELVYNAVKHAAASKIMVQCSQSESRYYITVEDNGKGYIPEKIADESQGLKNIRSRISLLNGKLDIDTSIDGTNVNIELYV